MKDAPGYRTCPIFSADGRTLVLGRSEGVQSLQPIVLLEAPSLAQIDAAEKAEAEANIGL